MVEIQFRDVVEDLHILIRIMFAIPSALEYRIIQVLEGVPDGPA